MKIAVTGLNNVDNPGPGVPVIRSIKESSGFTGEIIGLLYDTLDPGAYLKGVADRSYMIPYPSGGLDAMFDRINFIHQKERIDVLIPTLDAELYAFVKLAPRLMELGIQTFLPTLEQLNIRAKDKLSAFCMANNIAAPKNILVSSIQDLHKIPSELNYPVVVKGIFYDAYVVNNFEEAHTAFNKISSHWGLPIIVQEFIKGEEFNVVALGDGKGKTVGAVSMKKLYITDKGKGWAGVTIKDPVITELSNNIIEKLKWQSGAELEFVKDSDSNKYYLLEINPRFPAWVYLAVGAGQNLPAALVDLALGKNVDYMTDYEVGTVFIRYSWDYITSIKEYEKLTVNGEISHG